MTLTSFTPALAAFFVFTLLSMPGVLGVYCTEEMWGDYYGNATGNPPDCTWIGIEWNESINRWHTWNVNSSIEPEIFITKHLLQFANRMDRVGWATYHYGVAKQGTGLDFDYSDLNISNIQLNHGTDDQTFWYLQGRGEFRAFNRNFTLRRREYQIVNDDYMTVNDTFKQLTGNDVSGPIWMYWYIDRIDILDDEKADTLKITFLNGSTHTLSMDESSPYTGKLVGKIDISDSETGLGITILTNTTRLTAIKFIPNSSATNGNVRLAERVLKSSETLSPNMSISSQWSWIDVPVCNAVYGGGFGGSCLNPSVDTVYVTPASYNTTPGYITHYNISFLIKDAFGYDCTYNVTDMDGCLIRVQTNKTGSWANLKDHQEDTDTHVVYHDTGTSDYEPDGLDWWNITLTGWFPTTYHYRFSWYNEHPTDYGFAYNTYFDDTSPEIVLSSPANNSLPADEYNFVWEITDYRGLRNISFYKNDSGNTVLNFTYKPPYGNYVYEIGDMEQNSAFGCDWDEVDKFVCSVGGGGGTCSYTTVAHRGTYGLKIVDGTSSSECCIRFYSGALTYRECTTATDWAFINETWTMAESANAYFALENNAGDYQRAYTYTRDANCEGTGVIPDLYNITFSVWAYYNATEDACYFDDFMILGGDDKPAASDVGVPWMYSDVAPYFPYDTPDCTVSTDCPGVSILTWGDNITGTYSHSDNKWGIQNNSFYYGGNALRCSSGEICSGSLIFENLPLGIYRVSAYTKDFGGSNTILWFQANNQPLEEDNIAATYAWRNLVQYANVTNGNLTLIMQKRNPPAPGDYTVIVDRIHVHPLRSVREENNNFTISGLKEDAPIQFTLVSCDWFNNCVQQLYHTVFAELEEDDFIAVMTLFTLCVAGILYVLVERRKKHVEA